MLLFLIALPKVIGPQTIAIAYSCCSLSLLEAIAKRFPLHLAPAIVGRAITIWKAIQKRRHEPVYKTNTRNEANTLRATTFDIKKMEEL